MSDILAVAEHRQGELRDVSHELITAGREMADAVDGTLHVAVVGGDAEKYGQQLNCLGVERVHVVPGRDEFNHDIQTRAIEQLADAVAPSYLFLPHTVNGLDYAPALADRLSCPLVTDISAFVGFDPIVVTREEYGGKVKSDYEISSGRVVLTLRPTAWPATERDGDAEIESFETNIDAAEVGSTVRRFEAVASGDIDISDANFVVAVGRGIEDEENLEIIKQLCETTGATLAASRPIVDNDWLPDHRQVGQSGKTVAPDVYIAIGISGAVQHVAGMKGSDTIIAINTDPDAPIFDVADYGVVDDLFDVVPALNDQFEE